jgi:hypothetical protein
MHFHAPRQIEASVNRRMNPCGLFDSHHEF